MSDGLKLLAVVVETGSVHVLREIGAELFIDEERQVYDFLRSHYRRYGELPALSTVEEDTGIDIPEAEENIAYYEKKIRDRRLYNELRVDYTRLKECLRTFDMDEAKEVVDSMRARTRAASVDQSLLNAREAAEDVLLEYAHAHENPGVSGVPTGWPTFDLITGGYQPGDLISWIARPEMGKTNMLLRQAFHAHQMGYSVLVVTMEMIIAQIMRRVMGFMTGIDPNLIRRGALSTYARRRLQELQQSMVGIDRLHIFSGGMKKKVGDVELLIHELRPDIVFIDGVYLMSPDSTKAFSKADKANEVLDSLKHMTIAQHLPIVITSQFNRAAGKKGKDGSLETVAYTDAISTHSSIIVSIQEGIAGFEDTTRRIVLIKGREGEKGEVVVHYKFRPVCLDEYIVDLEGDNDETGSRLDWTV